MQGEDEVNNLIRVVLVLLACALVQAGFASAASAGNHVFDPLLSLTGGAEPFSGTSGVAVDPAGYVYVANEEGESIDVFSPAGQFLVAIENSERPRLPAVDASGTVYVAKGEGGKAAVVRYTPTEYPPTSTTTYGSPVAAATSLSGTPLGVAVNQVTGHLFVSFGFQIKEYGSVGEDNVPLNEEIGEGILREAHGVAVDSTTGDIFVGSLCDGCEPIPTPAKPHVSVVYIFDSSGALKGEIDGADLPKPPGGFVSSFGQLFPAVDEQSGEVFVADQENTSVYRFVEAEGGGYEYLVDPELEKHSYKVELKVAVANGAASPNLGNVYVASRDGHLYAFVPAGETGAPIVTGTTFAGVSTTEAVLEAEVNPHGLPTSYHFEYVDEASFEGSGFETAIQTPGVTIGEANQPVPVSVALSGLAPDTTYRFRIVAQNCEGEPEAGCETHGEREEEGKGAEIPHRFATYPAPSISGFCPNEGLRIGPSATLPDCRAYELVTPPDTNGRRPEARVLGSGSNAFETQLAAEDGEGLLFMTTGGALPGANGNGVADGYEAIRTPGGWQTHEAGPSGAQSQAPDAGGASADLDHWFWQASGGDNHGSLVVEGKTSSYVRNPDGSFDLIGQGPLGIDPAAIGRWIAPGAAHMVFSSKVPLAERAPSAGIAGIYDRTADGTTHVVSLLPEDAIPAAGASVEYLGTSADGASVAFEMTEAGVTTLYLRRDNAETLEVTDGATIFAGIAAEGARLTYLKGGDLFSYDALSETSTQIGSGGKSVPVNVSAEGTGVYFVAAKVLAKGAAVGKDNLYLWEAGSGTISFIALLDHADVTGVEGGDGGIVTYGLGQWVAGIGSSPNRYRGPADDPSRTTPAGGTIVFESHADLTDYETDGHSQVYRYQAGSGELSCISCNPTLAAATSDSHLQVASAANEPPPTNAVTLVRNLSQDGNRAFFQSKEALVPGDVDHQQDVYEWVEMGTDGCTREAGCVALISSGHSAGPDYLYAAAPDGGDVFFTTFDLLVGADGDSTRSIYDARVGGGFVEVGVTPCAGEGCKGQPSAAPKLPEAPSLAAGPSGNVPSTKHCRKGQRKVKRGGKVRCVAKHKGKGKHHKGKAGRNRGGAR
jgi:hypothetical protein